MVAGADFARFCGARLDFTIAAKAWDKLALNVVERCVSDHSGAEGDVVAPAVTEGVQLLVLISSDHVSSDHADAHAMGREMARSTPVRTVNPPIVFIRTALVVSMLTVSSASFGQSDPYHISASEKAACLFDAERFCAGTYPDEGALMGCMKANRASLSTVCLTAFDAGLRKRHLK